jgi:hypothetical protein
MRRSTVLRLPLQLVFPELTYRNRPESCHPTAGSSKSSEISAEIASNVGVADFRHLVVVVVDELGTML